MFCGVYKLVVQAMIYEPGWGRTDIHTYTIDYGDVIELVDDNIGISGDITVDVDTNDIENRDIIAIRAKDLTIHENTKFNIGDKDIKGRNDSIEVDLENGSTVEYDPTNWHYGPIELTPTNNDIIEIDQSTGTIHSFENYATVSTTVTVAAKNGSVDSTFNITIIGGGYDYIGYLPVRPFPKEMEDDRKYHFDRDDQGFESDD